VTSFQASFSPALGTDIPDALAMAAQERALDPNALHLDRKRLETLCTKLRFVERFGEVFELYERAGMSPFPKSEDKKSMPCLLDPSKTVEDSYANVMRQQIATAIRSDIWATELVAQGVITDSQREQLVAAQLGSKLTKPLELQRRFTLNQSCGEADHPRLHDEDELLLQKPPFSLTNTQAVDIVNIARHTMGPGGFLKFYSVTPDGESVVIGGSELLRIVRMSDDINYAFTPKGLEMGQDVNVGVTPEDKMLLLGPKARPGIVNMGLGIEKSADKAAQLVWIQDRHNLPSNVELLGTFGQLQSALARQIASIVCAGIGADPKVDPISSLNKFVDQKIQELLSA
jgi:hypothetical protein